MEYLVKTSLQIKLSQNCNNLENDYLHCHYNTYNSLKLQNLRQMHFTAKLEFCSHEPCVKSLQIHITLSNATTEPQQ